jgi:hypothetical protein
MQAIGTPRSIAWAAIISLALVLPFLLLEFINGGGFGKSFPVVLFGLMWLLSLGFILLFMPLVRAVPAAEPPLARLARLGPRLILLGLIAWFWIALVVDQMPCFLGVPNCD